MHRTTKYKDPTYMRLLNSAKWKHLRREVLMSNPLCEICYSKGIVAPAEEVHHIKPIQTGKTDSEKERLAFNTLNLQALCHECHKAIHTRKGKPSKWSKEEREKRRIEEIENFKKTFLE